MGTVGDGPMIGNNRSASTPNGEQTKFHEHLIMGLWIGGGRVENLVGSVIGGMAWADHRFVCFAFVAKHLPHRLFCIGLIHFG